MCICPAVPTVSAEPISAGAPAFTYYALGAVCAVVILAIFVVLLLGVIAYKRCVSHAHIIYTVKLMFQFSNFCT